jgi:signal transduction histidine kinase
MVLVSTVGLSPDEIERMRDLVEHGTGLFHAVFSGSELWSDDPDADELRDRLATWGGGSGLSVPILTTTGVAGNLSLRFADGRGLDPSFRDAVRSLAAQAGLAFELIAARDELRRAAADAEAQRRMATAFYAVASRLASVTEPGVVPRELVSAIRSATGAMTAAVALRKGDSDEFEVAAIEGASPEQEAIIASTPLTPEHFPSLRALVDGQAISGDARSAMAVRLDLGGGAAAPIILDGTARGFLSITVAPGDTFDTESWHELAKGFASVAATAIARVEAVAEVHAQREMLASAVAERTVQLREAIAELRSASEAKTTFLANVSHELRTPMTAILGFTEILVGGDDGPLNPRQHEDATTILSSSRRLLELIDDLIDISRIESDRLEMDMRPVALAPLLSEVVEQLRALAGAKGIGLSFQAPEEPVILHGDPTRLQEAFLNLVSNAVKFTGPGGTVRVVTELEPPATDGQQVRIDVVDTGIGIPAEEHERIFEKFHRLAGPEHGGTGLGLAIAREFIARHGGSLTVESTVGLGSCFSVRLPLVQATATTA